MILKGLSKLKNNSFKIHIILIEIVKTMCYININKK